MASRFDLCLTVGRKRRQPVRWRQCTGVVESNLLLLGIAFELFPLLQVEFAPVDQLGRNDLIAYHFQIRPPSLDRVDAATPEFVIEGDQQAASRRELCPYPEKCSVNQQTLDIVRAGLSESAAHCSTLLGH